MLQKGSAFSKTAVCVLKKYRANVASTLHTPASHTEINASSWSAYKEHPKCAAESQWWF